MMMMLIFLNSLVLLIGYELNVSITQLKYEAEKRLLEEQENIEESVISNNGNRLKSKG
jgi:membrane protein